MNFVIQFLIITAFSFAGELLHYFIPLPIPASIYGIILLFTALKCKLIKISDIREVSLFLIATMPIMFIPAATGLIDSWSIVRTSLVKYLAVTFLSTFVVMGISGLVTQFVIRKNKRK